MKGIALTAAVAFVLLILLAYYNYNARTYGVGDEIILGNLSLKVLETKTDHKIVRRSIVVNEFPGWVYVSESKSFEIIDAFGGQKFFLVKMEMKNVGGERLHLMGKEYKVLSTADGEIFYAGVLSRETRNASDDESIHNRYPLLITTRTLLPGQRVEGWIMFEVPEAAKPKELIWYSEFQNRIPSFRVKMN